MSASALAYTSARSNNMALYKALIETSGGDGETMGSSVGCSLDPAAQHRFGIGRTHYPSRFVRQEEPTRPGTLVVHRFDAATPESAGLYFKALQASGCPMDPATVHRADAITGSTARLWHWRGVPWYARRQMGRLDIYGDDRFLKQLNLSPDMQQVEGIFGELCQRYHKLPREDGVARMGHLDRPHVSARLAMAKTIMDRARVVAAVAEHAYRDACRSFGIPSCEPEEAPVATPAAPPEPDATIPPAPPQPNPQPSKAKPAKAS